MEEEHLTKTTGAIECARCGQIFYTMNFGRENMAATCSCSNVKITLQRFKPPARTEFYILLDCGNRKDVKLYDVFRETLERVNPDKDY